MNNSITSYVNDSITTAYSCARLLKNTFKLSACLILLEHARLTSADKQDFRNNTANLPNLTSIAFDSSEKSDTSFAQKVLAFILALNPISLFTLFVVTKFLADIAVLTARRTPPATNPNNPYQQ